VQFIKDPKKRTPFVVEACFNSSWLDSKAENDPEGRTNREVQIMVRVQSSQFDRRVDMPHKLYNERAAMTRIQKPLGAISQMWAGLTHRVDAKRLAQISNTTPKVLILTGDQDHLVKPTNSTYLSEHMPEAELVVWKDTGHVVSMQHIERFNTLLERVFRQGQEKLHGS
jgi:pimeloyl-ACP methyl ester carboxylesterase